MRKQVRGSRCQGPEGRTKNKLESSMAGKKADVGGPQGTGGKSRPEGGPCPMTRKGLLLLLLLLFYL